SLVNVRRLASEAIAFRNAQTEAGYTIMAVPEILAQTAEIEFRLDGSVSYEVTAGGRKIPAAQNPGIFKAAHDAGYNTAIIGFYLDYRRVVGSQVDYV